MSSVRDNHVKVKGLLKLPKGRQKNHVFHMQEIMSGESMWQKKIIHGTVSLMSRARGAYYIRVLFSQKNAFIPHPAL